MESDIRKSSIGGADDNVVSQKVEEQIMLRIKELKEEHQLKKVFAIVVAGDAATGEQNFYIGYFKRPNMHVLGTYLSMVQKDVIQAASNLAKLCFLEGDKELINDEDIFCYGTMAQLPQIIESRDSKLLKL